MFLVVGGFLDRYSLIPIHSCSFLFLVFGDGNELLEVESHCYLIVGIYWLFQQEINVRGHKNDGSCERTVHNSESL
jgi:hypothetical protein